MVTVVGMSMIVDSAGLVIENMSANDKYKCKGKKPVLIVVPNLFSNEKSYPGSKNDHGHKAVMMTAVAMPQRI